MFLVGNRQVTRVRGEHDLMNADFWRGTAREIMFRNYAKHDWPREDPSYPFHACIAWRARTFYVHIHSCKGGSGGSGDGETRVIPASLHAQRSTRGTRRVHGKHRERC